MESNPFVYGREVSGDNFYGRENDLERLTSQLGGGSANVVLYAPRRYGKTSLAKIALAALEKEGARCIYFDMMRVESVHKFCQAYASSVYALERGAGRVVRSIGKALSSLRPKLSIGDDGNPSLELDMAAPVSAATLESVLRLPELFATKKRPVIVAFDEFQEIGTLSPTLPLEGIFRSCIQSQANVRYLFLGSKTHLMKRMFGDKARPFYNSATMLRLDIPPSGESTAFVAGRFKAAGMKADNKAVDAIVSASRGVPYYIQTISAYTFDLAAKAGRHDIDETCVTEAIDALVEAKSDFYETALQSLSPAQRALLEALATAPAGRFDSAYRAAHGLGGSSSVHSSLEALLTKGYVESTGGRFALPDPLLIRYLAQAPYQIFSE